MTNQPTPRPDDRHEQLRRRYNELRLAAMQVVTGTAHEQALARATIEEHKKMGRA